MKKVGRRTVLRFGLGVGALVLLGCDVSQCGTCEIRGEDASEPPVATPAPAPAPTPPPGPPAAPSAWVVDPPSFAVGSGSTFNLATTLPAGVARGGVFDVSTSGASFHRNDADACRHLVGGNRRGGQRHRRRFYLLIALNTARDSAAMPQVSRNDGR